MINIKKFLLLILVLTQSHNTQTMGAKPSAAEYIPAVIGTSLILSPVLIYAMHKYNISLKEQIALLAMADATIFLKVASIGELPGLIKLGESVCETIIPVVSNPVTDIPGKLICSVLENPAALATVGILIPVGAAGYYFYNKRALYYKLHRYIKFDYLQGIKELVEEKNVNVNTTCYKNNQTPLMLAAKYSNPHYTNNNDNIISFLLDNKAEIDKTDDHGRTALIIAAQAGNEITVEVLLNAGADRTIYMDRIPGIIGARTALEAAKDKRSDVYRDPNNYFNTKTIEALNKKYDAIIKLLDPKS